MTELNQIEEIEKLCSKEKTYKIPKVAKEGQQQVSIKVMPLGIDDMSCIDIKEGSPPEEVSKKMKLLISKSLGISCEQVSRLSFDFIEDIMGAIMDVNNFDEKEVKGKGIKTFIAEKRELIKKEKELKENGTAGKPEE